MTSSSESVSTTQLQWRAALNQAVDACFERMVEVREHLHAHPELSGAEQETTAYLRDQLDRDRFDVRTGPDSRGLIVEPTGGPDGPRIALRADLDALRMTDAKQTSYRSTRPGVMHACGHDGHAAVVLGVVWALEQTRAAGGLPDGVSWRAVFQPAEETNRGALEMMDAGALEDVDAMLAAHLDPSREVGTIGVRDGAFTADCVELRIRIVGKGGHAARPHESLDPIAVAAQLINSVYSFVPRTADATNPIVVSFGQIHGGTTPNVIPDEVVLDGTLRTLREGTRVKTMSHIQKLSRALAEASDTRIDIAFIEGPPALWNDAQLTALIREEATRLLGPERVQEIPQPSMGGEDFANYLERTRGAMFRLGCAPPGRAAAPLHSSLFDIDREALRVGAKLLAASAVEWSLRRR